MTMKSKIHKWQIISAREIVSKDLFSLVEKRCYHPVKKIDHRFYSINSSDWINVIPVTADGKIIMLRQHRLGTDEITIETPGGVIETDESPATAAMRELKEETGYEAETIQLLSMLSSNPSIMNNHIYFYLASGCRKTCFQNLDQSEDIEVEIFSQEEILKMIKDGIISHSIVVTAFLLYFFNERDESRKGPFGVRSERFK